ncbi:MAG: hypothetical protein CL398_12190 [Acidiferrobacteraceae bacterium]|nr:hypothetical protein [Acidiferrobacteraceae bacterium]
MVPTENQKVVIVGGGQAAAFAIKAIGAADKVCSITLVSNEDSLPYDRPPLSKKCITGAKSFDSCLFFDDKFYRENQVELILGCRVDEIDFGNRSLNINNRRSIKYDKLLITTGSRNRTLEIEGIAPGEILQLRTIEESKTILAKVQSESSVLIIGGGFIGLELAASLSSLGKSVTVVEANSQLMGRSIPFEIASVMQSRHESAGVNIVLNSTVGRVHKEQGSYTAELEDGRSIVCGLIIAGIGVEPNVNFLEESSIALDNGIVVDEFGSTSIDGVYAAGDVANFYHPLYQRYMRLESWKHAQGHGSNTGKSLIGSSTEYSEIPWMWSDQYEYSLQLSGVTVDYTNRVQRGRSVSDGIIYFYMHGDQVIGACGISEGPKIGRDIRVAGQLAKSRLGVDIELLADPNQKLQALL